MILMADIVVILVSLMVGMAVGVLCSIAFNAARFRPPDEKQLAYMRGYMDGLDNIDRRA